MDWYDGVILILQLLAVAVVVAMTENIVVLVEWIMLEAKRSGVPSGRFAYWVLRAAVYTVLGAALRLRVYWRFFRRTVNKKIKEDHHVK